MIFQGGPDPLSSTLDQRMPTMHEYKSTAPYSIFFLRHLIPLFHTGHESPESPRIDFFLFGGIREVSLFFFSNRDELRVIPDSETMPLRIFGRIGSIRLESRKNSLRLENNIRTCCTKVKESITNQLRICGMQRGMQHELGTN